MRAGKVAWVLLLVGCAAEGVVNEAEDGRGGAGGAGGSAGAGGGGNNGGQGGAGGGAGGATATTSVGGSEGGSGGSGGAGGLDPTGSGGGATGITEVYGHSPSVLYKLDPVTKVVAAVGPFSGCSGVADIAIDENNDILGSASGGLYHIDRQTAVCTLIASGTYPNSLSFVPKGTLDPNVEALVGYNANVYVRIDPTTGNITSIGNLGPGFYSSGDIVSVKNGGTYLTVFGGGCGDCLVEVNPQTGSIVNNLGPLGHAAVYGIAFWGGKVYGFSDAGNLFEVTLSPSLSTTLIPIPSAPPGLQFWGAGSSTSVPVGIPE